MHNIQTPKSHFSQQQILYKSSIWTKQLAWKIIILHWSGPKLSFLFKNMRGPPQIVGLSIKMSTKIFLRRVFHLLEFHLSKKVTLMPTFS